MIVPIEKVNDFDSMQFGEKAKTLSILSKENINIAEGYVISFLGFTDFLSENNIRINKKNCLARNKIIQNNIICGNFNNSMTDKLFDIYESLANPKNDMLVIRSSASIEDQSTRSMAGVFNSYTGISSFDEMTTAIKKCYASSYSDKSISLMMKYNIDLTNLKMGILIQKFIPGELSGVVFTADTINMDSQKIVVNVANGNCEEFVGGTSESSSYTLNKTDGSIVSSGLNADVVISKKLLTELWRLSLKIDNLLGYYQDIEWTYANGSIYIFQSRPITTFIENDSSFNWPAEVDGTERVWIYESVHNKPISPLQEEILKCNCHGTISGMKKTGKGKVYSYRIINGYVFTKTDFSKTEIRAEILQKVREYGDSGLNVFQDDILPLIENFHTTLGMLKDESLNEEPRGRTPWYLRSERTRQAARYSAAPNKRQILRLLKKAMEFMERYPEFHFIAVDGSLYLNDFKEYCNEKGHDLSEDDFFCLVYKKSVLTREREKLFSISQFVNSSDELKELFNSTAYDEILIERLGISLSGRRLILKIDDYLSEYGLMPKICGQNPLAVSEVLYESKCNTLAKIRACINLDFEYFKKNMEGFNERKNKLIQAVSQPNFAGAEFSPSVIR